MDYDLGSVWLRSTWPLHKTHRLPLCKCLTRPFLFLLWYFHFVQRCSFWVRYIFHQGPFCEAHILFIYSKAFFIPGRQFRFLWKIFRSYCHCENTFQGLLSPNFKINLLIFKANMSIKFFKMTQWHLNKWREPPTHALFFFSGYLWIHNKLL